MKDTVLTMVNLNKYIDKNTLIIKFKKNIKNNLIHYNLLLSPSLFYAFIIKQFIYARDNHAKFKYKINGIFCTYIIWLPNK